MAGYSVMVKEITSQTDQYITHVFLQAGVGGMAAGTIAGIAKYFKKIPKIIIVEPETADCVLKSVEKGTKTLPNKDPEAGKAWKSVDKEAKLLQNKCPEDGKAWKSV